MKKFVHLPVEEMTLTSLLYGLGNPARLQIVRNLYAATKPLTCVQSIVGIEDLPVATRSHCFRVLRESGLITSQKKGRECYNALRLEEINQRFPRMLASILKQKNNHYA